MALNKEELLMEKERVGNGVKFKMSGRITAITANEFDRKLKDEIDCGRNHILLNMSNVTMLSSVGIRVILKNYKALMEEGGKLLIEDPSQSVKGTLGLSALNQMLVV